ncbi:hypothetical protein EDEG_00826 [Edhazardia aedis USNM 41457]|uniref:Uncharacterized protein n=1 Tax=Edhazardia aedis (strain USNM 41457) TaxID=1003232 RepID=J9DR59_EDHAE|nr:hypothetical protein EDEG_00826 [Edhazardia aedis USNM 41457]|eukprot:EJW05045.1 hypothetical protein EDEG_00826 [Edhazardia aedis USNM 41457]
MREFKKLKTFLNCKKTKNTTLLTLELLKFAKINVALQITSVKVAYVNHENSYKIIGGLFNNIFLKHNFVVLFAYYRLQKSKLIHNSFDILSKCIKITFLQFITDFRLYFNFRHNFRLSV